MRGATRAMVATIVVLGPYFTFFPSFFVLVPPVRCKGVVALQGEGWDIYTRSTRIVFWFHQRYVWAPRHDLERHPLHFLWEQ